MSQQNAVLVEEAAVASQALGGQAAGLGKLELGSVGHSWAMRRSSPGTRALPEHVA